MVDRRKARLQERDNEITIEFSEDLETPEIKEFLGALPQTVKYHRQGKTVVVENPKAFKDWMAGGVPRKPWWKRWFT